MPSPTRDPIVRSKIGDHQDVLQFAPNSYGSDNSGANSPPLWKNNKSPSPTHPLLSHPHHGGHGSLSPESRTQAIVRGQWELMEMVRNMPESSYELSLKDLVEHSRLENQEPQQSTRLSDVDGGQNRLRRRGGSATRQGSKRYEVKRGAFENKGLFLNVVSPFSSLRSKRRVVGGGGGGSGKVSPKPEAAKSAGGGEKDWWKKKLGGSTDSESSRASNNFGSSIGGSSSGGSSSSNRSCGVVSRKSNGCTTSCWPFLRSRKNRSAD